MDLDSAPNISIINGFTAMLGDRFEVLTVGSRIGEFATVNGLEVGGGTDLRGTYGPTELTLVVVAPQTVNCDPGPPSVVEQSEMVFGQSEPVGEHGIPPVETFIPAAIDSGCRTRVRKAVISNGTRYGYATHDVAKRLVFRTR